MNGKASRVVVALIGCVSGAAVQLGWLAGHTRAAHLGPGRFWGRVGWGALAVGVGLWLLQAGLRRAVARFTSPEVAAAYRRYDSLTYALFLAPLVTAFGVRLGPSIVFPVAFLFVVVQGLLVTRRAAHAEAGGEQGLRTLSLLFLVSGMAALIYQVCWQRVLFAAFGIDLESVTIVVSVFMLGLGLGSFVGGQLSRRLPSRLPHLFLVCELGIGVFGVFSIGLIERAATLALNASRLEVGLAIFALLAIPTTCMGATLPVLVAHLHRHYKNVGRSVGQLYFVNTLGSAVACFIAADLLFVVFDLDGAVYIAAALNLVVGALVYRYATRLAAPPVSAAP